MCLRMVFAWQPRDMGRKSGRRSRLKFFDHGNTKCPICLTTFTRDEAANGQRVTLEHAPPKTLGGMAVGLTCKSCNSAASQYLDQSVAMVKREIANRKAGRSIMELDFLGTRHTFSLWPKGSEAITRPHANNPATQRLLYSKRGVIAATSFRVGPVVNREQGIRIRFKPSPHPKHVMASALRSAFLMVFSLLGREGYRYVESEPIRPIREQILKPGGEIFPPFFCGFTRRENSPGNLIMLNFGCRPYFWLVKIAELGVLLPCGGGSAEDLKEVMRMQDQMKSGIRLCKWLPMPFGRQPTERARAHVDTALGDGDLIGLQSEEPDDDGKYWIMVDSQGPVGTTVQIQSARPRSGC